ncbi:signal recognition particle-docking protein FtsY [Kangiella shandongensis]|uniref:signal recognition particle-docking protein FtsY n=1 Tax=Kangiella shandongensis TaxID=2763258 RepID=UPI001CBDDAB8|nr:signal recognition particle-docking protein FtsY [Kangiella shandongensis]
MSDNKSKKRGLFGWFGKKDESSENNDAPEALEEKLEQAEEAIDKAIEQDLEEQLETDDTDPVTEATKAPPTEDLRQQSQSSTANEETITPDATPDKAQATPLPAKNHTETQERPTRKGFFSRLKDGLSKTRSQLTSGIADLVLGSKQIDDELLEEIETQLLMADVGVEATRRIIDDLTEKSERKELKNPEALMERLRQLLSEILAPCSEPLQLAHKPHVILMVGVNGVGKTTTIGKLAKKFQQEGKSVMLAAGDTFRAAAVEQLQVWGERNNIHVTAQHTGADSASVIFDALQSAQSRNVDVLIADTAGRLHTKSNLMDELAKVKRVMQKLDPSAPHEVMLVVDAGTGQNALNQAEQFHKAINLTGVTITKLDGTAKGGIIFALADKLQIPIRFIGVGEGIDDLREFNANDFIEALFTTEEAS